MRPHAATFVTWSALQTHSPLDGTKTWWSSPHCQSRANAIHCCQERLILSHLFQVSTWQWWKTRPAQHVSWYPTVLWRDGTHDVMCEVIPTDKNKTALLIKAIWSPPMSPGKLSYLLQIGGWHHDISWGKQMVLLEAVELRSSQFDRPKTGWTICFGQGQDLRVWGFLRSKFRKVYQWTDFTCFHV